MGGGVLKACTYNIVLKRFLKFCLVLKEFRSIEVNNETIIKISAIPRYYLIVYVEIMSVCIIQ